MKDTDVRPAHPILAKDHASAWLGIDVVQLEDGHATISMRLREEMLNGFGIAHGGMVFAFADSAFALACNPMGETDTVTVASGVDINFISAALPGELLTAVANKRASTGRSGIYDITITAGNDDGGRLVALFTGRSRTIPNRSRTSDPSRTHAPGEGEA